MVRSIALMRHIFSAVSFHNGIHLRSMSFSVHLHRSNTILLNVHRTLTQSQIHCDANVFRFDRRRPAAEVLAEITDEQRKELQKIETLHDLWVSTGEIYNMELTDEMKLELLGIASVNGKRKCIQFHQRRRILKEKDQREKLERSIQNSSKKEVIDDDGPTFMLHTMIRRLVRAVINAHETNELLHATMFGQPIIWDLGFESTMCSKRIRQLARQIQMAYSQLKRSRDPFHIVLCNLDPDGELMYYLGKMFTSKDCGVTHDGVPLADFPFTITSKSYSDLFPDANFLYFSPDSKNSLRNGDWDPTWHPIIGGIVDSGPVKPYTLAKARREGIRDVCLPIDRYVKWDAGTKMLTLDQMADILNTAKLSEGNWELALQRHLPSRKVRSFRHDTFSEMVSN